LREGIEAEFPWTATVAVESTRQLARIFSSTVSLILIDIGLLRDAEQDADEIFKYHPLALTALIDSGTEMNFTLFREILSSRLVRGVVPLSAGVEVSLPIVALLLRGIEYYPRPVFADLARTGQAEPVEPEPPARLHMDVLTKREVEILDLVERGLPNKSIANQLNLSDYTVKVHMHNIITKLGVQNRTAAAALLHRGRRQDDAPALAGASS
jgi:DNA-binding NarL/FixJ family response regulator